MSDSLSLRDFIALKDPRYIHGGLFLSINNYDSFVESVQYAIQSIIQPKLEATKHTITKDENHVSDQIVNLLHCLNYNATRETSSNGNVDVTVELMGYFWIAEAKIYRDITRLIDGFRQISTRYATISDVNNKGGFLIYNFDPNTKLIMDNFKTSILDIMSSELDDFKVSDFESCCLRFYSSHTDVSTGLNSQIKHLPFSFHFNPTDASGVRSKKGRDQKAEAKVKKLLDNK